MTSSMTTAMRRASAPNELMDWMSRFFEDRLPERFAALADRDLIRVEQVTKDGTLVIRAELPGIDPDEDVSLSVHDGLLHLRAERKERAERTEGEGYRTEFHYGVVERTVPLPAGITGSDVTATYKDGILEVIVPLPSAPPAAEVPVIRLP